MVERIKNTGFYRIQWILLVVLLVSGCFSDASYDTGNVHSFMLSWQSDPTSTMTIDWHAEVPASPWLEYREEGAGSWIRVEGTYVSVPETNLFF
ncbi:hypothetical protein QLX67_11080, partial [Balneolaceae bacterium ANBcel3]|nr:hypothetical protein [Balneolaceae bacterium ANBcel3]